MMMMFLWPRLSSLQMFTEGTVSGPVHIVTIFQFSSQFCSHDRCNCHGSSSCSLRWFRQSSGQWRTVSSDLRIPPEDDLRWYKIRGTRWSSVKVISANQFPWNFLSNKSRTVVWKWGSLPPCWNSAPSPWGIPVTSTPLAAHSEKRKAQTRWFGRSTGDLELCVRRNPYSVQQIVYIIGASIFHGK
jgi:hypothetical protein